MVETYDRNSMRSVRITTNFVSGEFFCKCGKCNPQKIDRENVETLQTIRNIIELPLHINSAYRCPAHNAAIGGSATSQHMQGRAADVRNANIPPVIIAQLAEYLGAHGIGLYNTFTHIDNRQGKTYHGYWGSGKKCLGYPGTFFLTVRNGMKNSDCNYKMPIVTACQWMLNKVDSANLKIDGSCGSKTDKAIRAFQKKHDLKVDGICGKNTWDRLFSIWVSGKM